MRRKIHLTPCRILRPIAVPAVADDLLFRSGHRRPGGPPRRARRKPRGYRRDPPSVRSRPAAVGAILAVRGRPLAHGDFGQSFYYVRYRFCSFIWRPKLPNSLMLAAVAMGLSLLIGIPSGILASVQVGRFWDNAGKLFALLGLSIPSFLVGLVLILVFSVYLGWLPSSGAGTPLHFIMPAFALGWYFAASHMRLTRSSMLEVLGSEYIKLARLKGLPQSLAGDRQARLQECPHSRADARRDQPGDHGQRRGGGGDRVRLAGYRAAASTRASRSAIARWSRSVVLMGGAMIVMVNLLVDAIPLRRDRPPHPTGEVADEHPGRRHPPTPPRRAAFRVLAKPFRRRAQFPVIPTVILGVITFVAIFANVLAPHNRPRSAAASSPASSRPSGWPRGSGPLSARHRSTRPRRCSRG